VVLYSDDEHLTYRGSTWLGSDLAKSAAWLAMSGQLAGPEIR
jgi:hypothetical protein